MDKVKVILEHLKKHHFWVLCLAVLITGLIGWYSAASALSTQYKNNLSKIENEFKELDTVISNGKQANDAITAKANTITDELTSNVETVWKRVFDEQKQTVLKWPEQVKEIDSLTLTAEIDRTTREKYRNFLREQFPALVKGVGALTAEEQAEHKVAVAPINARGKGGQAGREQVTAPPPKKYVVVWDTTNQQQIQKDLVFPNEMSTLEVRQTQENLWVYQALVNIIAAVNKDASANYLAPIKRITEISIAQDATKHFAEGVAPNRIEKAPAIAAASSTATETAPSPVSAPAPAFTGTGVGGESRYVDAQGHPLPPEGPFPIEFKRIPVFMKLYMDQRKIPDLLVECANSSLPVEVRQLRVNPSKGGAVAGGAGGGGADKVNVDAGPFDQPVEIHGIVYLYNPPVKEKIGTVVEAAAPPAAPVSSEVSDD